MVAARVRAAAALGAGALLLAALVLWVGPGELARVFDRASPRHILLALSAYAAFFILRGLRWKTLLAGAGPRVPLSTTTGMTAVGWFANSVLPLKAGDVLRAALVAKRAHARLAVTGATVALERALDLIGLAVLAAIGLILVPRAAPLPDWLTPALRVAWVIPLVGLIVLALLVRARAGAAAVAHRAGPRIGNLIETTLQSIADLASRPVMLLLLAPMTLFIVTSQALVFAFLVQAFVPGTPLALAFAGGALFPLSFTVSLTPGNVGTYEAAFVAVFVALGVPTTDAVPAAVLTHIATTLIVALLAMTALVVMGARPPPGLGAHEERALEGGAP